MNPISLNDKYSDSNIFALILRGEAPCIKVYEDKHCLAFMDIMPVSKGHTLVIPKEPAVNLMQLSDDAAAHTIKTVKKVSQAVVNGLNAEGVTVVQLNGSHVGQTVPHLHFHIVPANILGGFGHGGKGLADTNELEDIAAKIREQL